MSSAEVAWQVIYARRSACIGCSWNAPDPERHYQIETKRVGATEQMELGIQTRVLNRAAADEADPA
jgi:hypothetical protein